MRKPYFCLCSNCEADQRLCFRYSDSTTPLLPKSEFSLDFFLYFSYSIGKNKKKNSNEILDFLKVCSKHRLWVHVRTASPSNEYPQSMFWSKNKKNRYTPAYTSFAI